MKDGRSERIEEGRAPQLRRRVDGRLCARTPGGEVPVAITRCFPWSHSTGYVSLRDDDEEEVGLVRSLADLDELSRMLIEEALAESGFVLQVEAVCEVEEEVEIRRWRVETTSGPRSFQTARDDWPRVLPQGGLLIRDVAGDLYAIADPAALDARSRRLLWAFVDEG